MTHGRLLDGSSDARSNYPADSTRRTRPSADFFILAQFVLNASEMRARPQLHNLGQNLPARQKQASNAFVYSDGKNAEDQTVSITA